MQRFRDSAFDWVAWIFFAAVPVTIFWQCATTLVEEGVASGGPMENAAFYPEIVASVMTFLLVWLAMSLLLGRLRRKSPFTAGEGTGRALAATALFIGYLAVLPYAGFHLATPVLCFLLFRLLSLSMIPAVAGGIGLSLATAFVFQGLLHVVLPVGVLGITVFK